MTWTVAGLHWQLPRGNWWISLNKWESHLTNGYVRGGGGPWVLDFSTLKETLNNGQQNKTNKKKWETDVWQGLHVDIEDRSHSIGDSCSHGWPMYSFWPLGEFVSGPSGFESWQLYSSLSVELCNTDGGGGRGGLPVPQFPLLIGKSAVPPSQSCCGVV